jgi:hypothetical protein
MNKAFEIKNLKTKIKDTEKWKQEAIDLLQQKGEENIEQHKTIQIYNEKIKELQEKLKNIEIGIVTLQEKKVKEVKPISNSNLNTKTYSNDPWEETKINNMINRELKWLLKTSESLPSYIKENLNKMGCNKGYLWKNIYYFGEQELEYPEDVYTIYEKNYNIMKIHEYHPTYYREYLKENKIKTLIEEKFY